MSIGGVFVWGEGGSVDVSGIFSLVFFSDGGKEVPAVPETKSPTNGPSTGTRTCTGSSHDTSPEDYMQVLYL